jgi:hypothetical protein
MNPEIEFTFNELPFLKAIQNMQGSMSNMAKSGEQLTSKFSKNASSMVNAFTRRIAGIAGAYLSIRAIINRIPEIGQTFKIAGDIFMRNFLQPLRMYLLPMLQKLLDWVRDHRALFVKWGGVLVNVFKTIKAVVSAVFGFIKIFIDAFLSGTKGLFGKTVKSISDILNILLFRITVIVTALGILLKPLFSFLGTLVANLAWGFKGLFDGIKLGAAGIGDPINEIIKMFKEFLAWIGYGSTSAMNFYSVMKLIGDFVGTAMVIQLNAIIIAVKTLVALLKVAFYSLKALFQASTGDFRAAKQSILEIGKISKGYGADVIARGKSTTEAAMGFGKRTYAAMEGKQPEANLKATKGTAGKTINTSSNVRVDKIEISVKDAKEAEKAGGAFIRGVQKNQSKEIQQIIKNEMATEGF